jgi:hypothetical protein
MLKHSRDGITPLKEGTVGPLDEYDLLKKKVCKTLVRMDIDNITCQG